MATSDAPLNVPNVALALSRGATSPPPEPGNALFLDDFESYTNGEDLGAYDYSGLKFTADSSQSATGSQSGRIDFVAGGTAGGAVKNLAPLAKGQEIWMQFKARFDVGFLFNNSAGFKFLRLQVKRSDGSSAGYLDFYSASDRYSTNGVGDAWYHRNEAVGGVNYPFGDYATTNIDPGSWHKYEVYYYLDEVGVDAGGSGIARFWRDDVLIGEVTAIGTLENATDTCTVIRHSTFFNPSPSGQSFDPVTYTLSANTDSANGSPQNQGYNIDDFIIYTSDSPPTGTDAAGNTFIGAN